MSEQDYKYAATDAKQSQLEATREVAEIIADLIKLAMRERDGKEPNEAPKVEIFSGSNKVYPPREGVEITPEQVDNIVNTLAKEQGGSVRIYLEQNGKRDKIFHQNKEGVKYDPLGLKEKMAAELGPKLAERQQAKEEQSKVPTGIDALKAIYNQDKDAYTRQFPASANAIETGMSDESISHQIAAFDTSITPQAGDRDFAYHAHASGAKVPESIEAIVQERQQLNESLQSSAHALRESLEKDAPVEQVQSALVSVQLQKMKLQENQVNLQGAMDNFVADLSQDPSLAETYQEFVDLHEEWHPNQSWHEAIAIEQERQSQSTQESEPSYAQSPDTPSLDHPERTRSLEVETEVEQPQEQSPAVPTQSTESEEQSENQSQDLNGVEALKAVYQENPDWFARHFPVTAQQLNQGSDERVIHNAMINFDAVSPSQERGYEFLDMAYRDRDEVLSPHPLSPLMNEATELVDKLADERQALGEAIRTDAPMNQVQAAALKVAYSKILIADNFEKQREAVSDFATRYSESPSLGNRFQDFIAVQKEWNPGVSWQDYVAVENSLEHQSEPTQSNGVETVLNTIDNAPAPIPEKAQEIIDNAPAVYQDTPEAQPEHSQNLNQTEEQYKTVDVNASPSESVKREEVPDIAKFPEQTQAQTSNIDPALQAAKAEFDRKFAEFQNYLDAFQSQVQQLSEQVAPLINDPNLKRWTQKGSERHREAMRPIRNELASVRKGFHDRIKSAGQALDNLGRKATDKLSQLQAKAIDKSVSWLVNSRYGKETSRGGRVFEGENQTFKKVGNSIIISRNSDKAELYSNGRYTKSANTQDKKAIAALPGKVVDLQKKLAQKQSQSQSQQKSAGRSR